MFKHAIIASTILFISGCGRDERRRHHDDDCTTAQTADGAIIHCPDGSTSKIKNGTQGPQGTPGKDGASGKDGMGGSQGAKGDKGDKGDTGAQGATGPQGPTGSSGPMGPQGPKGEAGAQGTQGVPGAPGSTVTPVQFCPGQGPTVYPSKFPEYGLCVDGVIYAVYWDKAGQNAWLSQVVPGTYMSTATGLACNFTVSSNCEIE